MYISQLPATSSSHIHAQDNYDLAYGNKIRMLEVDLATRYSTLSLPPSRYVAIVTMIMTHCMCVI